MAIVAVLAGGLTGAADPAPPACTSPPERTTRSDPPAPLPVSISCSDPAGAHVSYVVVLGPEHGRLEPNHSSPGTYGYMPDAGFQGADSFIVRGESANGTSEPVEQRIVVDPAYNRAPWCEDVAFAVGQGRSRTHFVDCFDPDGDVLAVSIAQGPEHGTAAPAPFGDVTYTAPAGFLGVDPFTVSVDDGHGGTAVANVVVTVIDHNQPPVCRESQTVARSGKTDAVNVAGACTDPDGDPLTYELTGQPARGRVGPGGSSGWQIVVDPGFVGEDAFTMRSSDGVDSTSFTVRVRVVESSETIPECASRRVAAIAGVPLRIQLQCFDRDGDVPRLELRQAPAAATGKLAPIDQASQTVRFTADPDFTGTARFVYGAVDAAAGPSAPATVEVAVTRDGTAPALRLASASRQRRDAVLARGLAMVVRVDERSALTVRARLAAPTARDLGLARRPVVIGRARRSVAAGRTAVRVKLNGKARRALRNRHRSTTVRLVATATDRAGNRRVLPARVVVR